MRCNPAAGPRLQRASPAWAAPQTPTSSSSSAGSPGAGAPRPGGGMGKSGAGCAGKRISHPIPALLLPARGTGGGVLGAGCVRASPKRWHQAGTEPWHLPALPFTPSWHRLLCLRGPFGDFLPPALARPRWHRRHPAGGRPAVPDPTAGGWHCWGQSCPLPIPEPLWCCWVSSRHPAPFLTTRSGRGKQGPLPKSGLRGCRWAQRSCHVRNGACRVFIAMDATGQKQAWRERGCLGLLCFYFFQILLLLKARLAQPEMVLRPPALCCSPPRDARALIFGQLLCSERSREERPAEVGSGEVHARSWGFCFPRQHLLFQAG